MNNFFHSWFKDMKNGIVGKIVVGAPAGTPTTAEIFKFTRFILNGIFNTSVVDF
jgi:hypothetical protein